MAGLKNLKLPSQGLGDRYKVTKDKSALAEKNSNLDIPQVTKYNTTIDNSFVITRDTRFQNQIDISTGTSYLPSGQANIGAEFNPIQGSDIGRDYENRIYGLNGYKGSDQDDEIGGIFNGLTKYSDSFRVINTPTLDEIVTSGNIVTRAGYPLKKVTVDLVNQAAEIKPTKYFDGGTINIPGSSFNKRGITVEGIPNTNPLNVGSLQFRTVDVDVANLFPQELARNNLQESRLPELYKNLLNPRRSKGTSVGAEPFVTFDGKGIANEVNIGQSGNRAFPINSARINSYRLTQWMNNNIGDFTLRQTTLTGQSLTVGNEYDLFGNPVKSKRFGSKIEGVLNDLTLPTNTLGMDASGKTFLSERGYDFPGTHLLNIGLAAKKPTIALSLATTGLKYERRVTTRIGSNSRYNPKDVASSFLPKPSVTAGFFEGLLDPKDNYDPTGDPITTGGETGLQGLGSRKNVELIKDDAKNAVERKLRKREYDKLEQVYNIPFYFKDMRDQSVIILRAYVNGITENVKPSWNSSQFIGRSEPVYNYTHGERDINLNLKLMAGTKKELESIYFKMNRLTSLAYPEYQADGNLNNKIRMKPPLTKLRYGDLYNAGKTDNNEFFTGLLGFITSLTYTVPDTATYELDSGKKIPQYIEVAIAYTVIHNETPNIQTQFYGYDGKTPGSV